MQQKKREIAFDLIRAMAIILMIEGHTVDVFLSDVYRNESNFFFQLWTTIRGFTAPFFMITAGAVYTFLLYKKGDEIDQNRLQKGFKRGFKLLIVGYLLRFPSFNPYQLFKIEQFQWNTFSTVDALHIIGLGLITINLIYYIERKIRISLIAIYSIFTLLFWLGMFVNPFIASFDFPFMLRAYFTRELGTIFTLFPWVGFLTFGSIIGLLVRDGHFVRSKSIFKIMGITLTILAINTAIFHLYYKMNYDFYLIIQRASFVVFIFTIFFLLEKNLKRDFSKLAILGRKSLLIYVVHLFILYGSPISLGFYQVVPHSLSLGWVVVAVLIMEISMISLALNIDKKLSSEEFYGKIYKYKPEFKFGRKRI